MSPMLHNDRNGLDLRIHGLDEDTVEVKVPDTLIPF